LFSKFEVDKIFDDVASRTLRSWIELGLVQWANERRDRRGTNRLFATENLYQFAVVRELAAASIPLAQISTLMHGDFSSRNISSAMNKLMGIAINPGNERSLPFLGFDSREPEKAGEMIQYLLSLPHPKRAPLIRKDNTQQLSIGLGPASGKRLSPLRILLLNLPEIKADVDAAINREDNV
jgi:DNA-binding transcriptional MerR regulator